MGSTESVPQWHPMRLNPNNWSPSEQEPWQRPQEYGNYRQLKNKMTGQEIDEYQLVFSDQDDYRQFMDVLLFRNRSDFLVNVLYMNEEKIDHLCSLIVNVKLYLEHFPLRLCDVQAVPFPQNIYILTRVFAGFGLLYQQVGSNLHQRRRHGEGLAQLQPVKVLQPGDNKVALFPKMFEAILISRPVRQKYLKCNEQITDKQSLPEGVSFLDYLKKINRSHLDFTLAQELAVAYVKNYDIQIPEVFESALKVMRERKGIFDSEVDVTNMKKVQEIDLANLGSRFKESKVERVQSVKNVSVRSYIASESNHTFADKLKNYDRAKARVDLFGKASDSKDTPIKTNFAVGPQLKQPLTQRIAPNQMSFSSISSPQAQSLTAIGQANRLGTFPTSNSNSEIISQQKQKNPLTLSESPPKEKAMTYFSQYIDPLDTQTKIVKKPTIFSFGEVNQELHQALNESNANEKVLKNVPITQSLQNSKNETHPQHRPLVTFTYNPSQPQPSQPVQLSQPGPPPPPPSPSLFREPRPQKILIQPLSRSSSIDQIEMPISPPSVDKSSSMFMQQGKQSENAKASQGKDQYKDEVKEEVVISREYAKEVVESLYCKVVEEVPADQGPAGNKNSIRLNECKIEQSRERPRSEDKTQRQPVQQVPAAMKNSQQIENILLNQFDLDPEIVSDLVNYESHRLAKKRSRDTKKL